MKKVIAVLFLLLVALVGAGYGYFHYRCRIAEPEWILRPAGRGELRKLVSATGALAAINVVEVGTQISGTVSSLTADFNDHVRAGQVLAQIDASTYETEVERAKANLEQARATERNLKAQLLNLKGSMAGGQAEIDSAKAGVRKAEISLESAHRNLRRLRGMHEKKLLPQADLDDAVSNVALAEQNLESSRAQCKVAESRLRSADFQIEAAQASLEGAATTVRQMEALLNVARINLSRTRIVAPVDGVVLARKVSVGQTVAASFQTPTLFTIAEDLRRMQIEASVDESDVCHVKPGQPATFTVDAFGERPFPGVVSQVRPLPNVTNVVMFTVIIDVPNPDLLLKPGLTAKAEILVESKPDVLRVPTEALFFTPPPDVLRRYPTELKELEATETMRIWVIATSGRALPVDIRTGLSNAALTEVLDPPPGVGSGTPCILAVREWWMYLLGRR